MTGSVTLAPNATAPVSPRLGSVAAAAISAALLGANVLSYGFTVLAARLLAPATYGELAALMGLLLVGAVPSAGLQTAVALHLGRAGGGRPDVRGLHAAALMTALGVGVAGLLAVAPVMHLLHLSDAAAVGWLAVLLIPHTVIGGYQGILQGRGSYRGLSVITAVFGLAKPLGGAAGLLLGGTPTAALAGMALGACAGAVIGWLGCGRPGVRRGMREPARAVLRASGALLGFVVLLNLDLLLARHYLPATAAGEYAVASLFAKIAFWLPQGVGVVLLPRLAEPEQRRRALPSALALVAGVGTVVALGTAALGSRALPLVGGAAYGAELGSASWLFAVLGTLLAVVQLLVYSGIAAADRVAVTAVWTAAGAECAVVAGLAGAGRLTVTTLVVTAVGVASVVVGAGLVHALRGGGAPDRAL
ncbi:MAG: lipopolysaccharide biosynthesis protein [Blastococcus sp.]